MSGFLILSPSFYCLSIRNIVDNNNAYYQYMLMKWTPIFLEPNSTELSSARITLPVSIFSNIVKQDEYLSPLCSRYTCDSAFSSKHLIRPELQTTYNNQVVQTRYGINEITYKVKLAAPKLMIENEIYFPGWEAVLIFPHKEMKLEASVVNGAFRAWFLPAGNYIMIAHFHYPNFTIYQSITIISLGMWIYIIARYWRRLEYKEVGKREEFVT